MEKIIEISGLSKIYPNGRGIKDISFGVEKGDVVGLLGPNGSGKTTTMKIISGLCHAQSGDVKIFGMNIEDNFEDVMKRCGILIEAPALYENLSAKKNLELAAGFYPNVTKERIDRALETVRLLQYKNDKAGRFSLGMKQRLGLALALLSEPELLILDEPTNGIDIEGMVEIREIITRLSTERGTTVLISSHLAGEIEKVCNKVSIMYEGEMLTFTDMTRALEFNPTLEEYFLSVVKEKRGGVVI
ncbi:MAG: ABC transporter ATP-binding protein [Oscillospiraceae bacterium]|nr:ABC transporter ATP-binding protein [Oscillospiraceae bacterium]